MPAARIVSSVQRADSLRSERSDLSQANKRVSFNRDVDVKHIKQQQQQQQQQHQQPSNNRSRGSASSTSSNSVTAVAAAIERYDAVPAPVHPFPYNVYKEPTLLSEAELAQEAERIIQQVDQISCTVSPNPLLAATNYETRSLERNKSAKRNNNNQQGDPGNQWSRTLPATASTKNNQLAKKTKNNIEKNNLVKSDNLKSLDPIDERRGSHSPPQTMLVDHRTGQFVSPAKQNRDAATTPPKYDSGIEMDSRPSVNLIVQQLTEEARQREMMRRQYQDELNDDPLAPRLPALNLIEPDPDVGLTHNKNLPFSYTGGSSPTRLSPLRTSNGRFASPPPARVEQEQAPPKKDIVYAQVKVSRERSQSPERNIFRSTNVQTDKVPPRAKLDFAQQTKNRRNYYDDEEEEESLQDDLDAIKAKARFLFGDDGESRRLDARNNNQQRVQATNMLNNNNSGMSYKYSTIVKDRPPENKQRDFAETGRNYTTKIVIGGDRPARKYSYEDEELDNGRRRLYQDRSVSPEPRIQPVTSRIRSYEMASPERYPGEYRTLPLPAKKTNHVASSRLVQEAERGRTVVRNQRPSELNSSRLVRQASARYADEYDSEPPKPPIRLKKLSRERAEGSPVRTTGPRPGAKVGFNTVPWRDGSESSPERTLPRPQTTFKTKTYRLRTDTPSPERQRVNRWTDEPEVIEAKKEPEKEDKIRRQRSKFLSVFLGSKAGKSSNSKSTTPKEAKEAKQVRGQAPPVAKWSPDDEADFVRSRPPAATVTTTTTTTTTSKGQAHQSAIRSGAQRAIGQRKSAAPPVPVQQQQPQQVSNEASRYRIVSTPASANKAERRRSSTDRTDTSESEDAAHQRFKSMRQKSQSFNNLNYRPDPAVVLAEEQEDRRRRREEDDGWVGTMDRNQNHRASRVIQEQRDVRARNGALGDARPYASTNLIHQIGRPADVRRQISADNEIKRAEPPVQKEAPRQMRYFGDTDLESQQSQRGYASRYQPKTSKVMRSASTAAGVGAVRRGVIQRQGGQPKQPVSSVNSSESEGSALQSGASAESQRSVYLHATTVADIPNIVPATNGTKHAQLKDARRKAMSREDMSAISGQTGSTLRRTRHISRSYSVLAPWKPRHYRDKFEITYSNQQTPAMMSAPAVVVNNDVGKPPRAPRRQEVTIGDAEEVNDGYRSSGGGASRPSGGAKTGVSRSSTMPKNTKLMAGWFRKKKQR